MTGKGASIIAKHRPSPPSWLDKGFAEKALLRDGLIHEGTRVREIEIEYGVSPRSHYCSRIYRVTSWLHDNTKSLIFLVKVLPEEEAFALAIQKMRVFAKESIVFSRVLSAMDALLAEAAPGRFQPFAARCLHHGEQPSPFIVLQDLGPEGFRMGDRRKGLDLQHATLALKALGRFHGASAVLWKRSPELFDGLLNPSEEPGYSVFTAIHEKTCESVAKIIESWEDFPGDYARKMMSLKDKFITKIGEVNKVRPGKFNVLIHGDFWVNNILFQYDGNARPQDCRLVDFQVSHVGNLANDLLMFQCTSLTEEVFDSHWDTLLEVYWESLKKTLQILGEDVPTLADIRRDLHEARISSFMAVIIWIPIARLEGKVGEGADMSLNSSRDFANSFETSEACTLWLKKLLPIFDERGMFDDL